MVPCYKLFVVPLRLYTLPVRAADRSYRVISVGVSIYIRNCQFGMPCSCGQNRIPNLRTTYWKTHVSAIIIREHDLPVSAACP